MTIHIDREFKRISEHTPPDNFNSVLGVLPDGSLRIVYYSLTSDGWCIGVGDPKFVEEGGKPVKVVAWMDVFTS